MNLKLILPIIITLSILTPTAYAYEYDYNIMPHEGTYNQEIFIWLRTNPIIDTNNLKVTVFWDKMLIKTMHQLPSAKIGKTVDYKHSWDLFLTPPIGANNIGKHKIEIWIETNTGEIKELPYTYEITEGPLTTVNAWERFIKDNPKILELITGPVGPIGDNGQRGVKGVQGDRGASGEDGVKGNIGLTGIQGPEGIQGKTGTPSYLFVLIICVISNVASIAYMKYKETT